MSTIKAGLLRLARRIGTWLVRRFATWVFTKVTGYMQARLDDWRARPRARQPKGRIRRWQAALNWLLKKKAAMARVTSTEFNALADHAEKKLGLPVVAKEAA